MGRSEPKNKSSLSSDKGGRKGTSRAPSFHVVSPDVQQFTLSSTRVKVPSPNRPIWSREKRFGRLFFFLFILITLLIAFITLGFASPPGSRGARPIALGNGYSAVGGDPYALYYNPAGLAELNQKEEVFDYGRSYSEGESARSDFNGTYAMPYKYKDIYVPLAFGLYGDVPAPGAHIIDLTVGGGADSPMDTWTKGLIKFPVRLGGAVTLRSQQGADKSDRVGGSKIGLGLTGGAFIPYSRTTQFGIALRNLFAGSADPDGPSLNFGVAHRYKDQMNLVADLQIGNSGVWRIEPGVEWLFSRGVLRPRLGWGFHDNGGIDLLATGVGVYLSPLQLDIAYLIPILSPNDNAGQFRASLSYRFGNPQFSEVYYDRALEAASQLDQNVMTMTVKEAELKASLAELEQKKRMAKEELENAKTRIESLKDQDLLGQRDAKIRKLENRIGELQSDLSSQRTETKSLRQKQATVRVHTVIAGDTLQGLAREYYGDPNQWKKIFNANPDKIDRGLPRIGEKLVIP